MRLSGAAIAAATGGVWHGGVPHQLTGICTDSRHFRTGDAFLALRGPNFDGHGFATGVADRASALIGEQAGSRQWRELTNSRLIVDDSLKALGDIAHAWRMQLAHTTVIAISGSYGKTTLRAMLETGLKAMGYAVAATRANLNNLIGVPQTLLDVPAEADLAVVECGISEVGEMERLAAMVQPDMAVLTGITAAHSEGLGALDGVVREKAKLLDHLNAHGCCLLGSGVSGLLQANGVQIPADTFALDQRKHDRVAWHLDGCDLEMRYRGELAHLVLKLPARHWAENLALAASVMLHYFERKQILAGLKDVAQALAGWQPVPRRMQILNGRDGMAVLDDCYNANPVSMQAAIDTLRALPGRHIAVLGDMAELGDESRHAHQQIDIDGLDCVCLIGDRMRALADLHPSAQWFANAEAAKQALSERTFSQTDTVLVKASRSMHLESLVAFLCNEEVAHAL